MAIIGQFSMARDGGWIGTIRTLTIHAKVRLVPNDRRDQANAPAYWLKLGHSRVGEAWEVERAGAGQRAYLRVRFDDPALPQPVWAFLFCTGEEGRATLIWYRHRGEGGDR